MAMAQQQPEPIRPSVLIARRRRIARIARRMGLVGRIEYRHVFGQAGGAQFGLAATEADDLLLVDAEAFDRDDDPEDFSLEAIIAHERGHQLLVRDACLRRNLPKNWSDRAKEVAASLIGSLLVWNYKDRDDLMSKATYDALGSGADLERAIRLVSELRHLLEALL